MKEINASTKKEQKLSFNQTYFKAFSNRTAAPLKADACQAIGN